MVDFYSFVLLIVLILVLLMAALVVEEVVDRAEQKQFRRGVAFTLDMAAEAIWRIEEGVKTGMPAEVVPAYREALRIYQRARWESQTAQSKPTLINANKRAAHAVIALAGTLGQLNLDIQLRDPFLDPGDRCFYCNREDRPPYTSWQAGGYWDGNEWQLGDVPEHEQSQVTFQCCPQCAVFDRKIKDPVKRLQTFRYTA